MNDNNILVIDKEEVYDKEIAPLVKKIYDVCMENRIPFFFSAITKNTVSDGKCDTVYQRECIHPGFFEKEIPDNEISKYLSLKLGFRISYTDELDFDMDGNWNQNEQKAESEEESLEI